MTLAAVLLTLALLGGSVLFSLRLRGGNPPLAFALVHGAFAVGGVVTLLLAVLSTGTRGAPLLALILFGLAAPLGVWMLVRHLNGKLIPLTGVVLHAMVALLGYTALLAHFF